MRLKMGLSVALCLSSLSFADKLPYNPTFSKAQYPYSQAADGCSSWDSNYPEYIPDYWGTFGEFSSTCDAHDRCYYTLGSNVRICNEQFRDGLQHACSQVRIEKRDSCRLIARNYETAVVEFEDETFAAAQDLQRRYLEYARSVFNDAYKFLSGEPLPSEWKEFYLGFLNSTDMSGVKADLLSRFGAQIATRFYQGKVGCSPNQEQLSRYISMLAQHGFNELWTHIVLIDYRLIVDDRTLALTGSPKPDDEIKHSLQTTLIANKSVAEIDALINSFYLAPPPPVPPPSPPSPTHPECDINTMTPWEYYDCLSRG